MTTDYDNEIADHSNVTQSRKARISKKVKDGYGYKCDCGKEHECPAYVIAHKDVELRHVCECGRKNIIFDLVATVEKIPAKDKK